MSGEYRYREGYEYVVCSECDSHVLLDDEGGWLSDMWDGLEPDEWLEQVIGFTCDWDPCGADFSAAVKRPEAAAPAKTSRIVEA